MKALVLERTKLVKALFYGDSGSGKTTLAGTAMEHPSTRPVLVLNARGQPVSLAGLEPPPLVVELESFKDFNIPYAWFADGQQRGTWLKSQVVASKTGILAAYTLATYPDELAEGAGGTPVPTTPRLAPEMEMEIVSTGKGGKDMTEFAQICVDYLDRYGFDKFQTVVVDSITHVQRMAIAQATGQRSVRPGDIPKPTEIQHWGSVLRMMANLTDLYFRLDVNVIMTALTRRDQIRDMDTTLFCPFLWGQSALEVPSHAEILGRLVVADTLTAKQRQDLGMPRDAKARDVPYNVLLTKGGRNFMAKWQGTTSPPDSIPAPTVAKIWEVLTAK